MAADSRLGGPKRTRLVAAVRARRQPCPMCGFGIDQTLQRTGRRHPLSSVVDEWIPRSKGGTVDLTNCVEMHSWCNGSKGSRWPVTDEMRERCRTHITHLLEATQPTIRPW